MHLEKHGVLYLSGSQTLASGFVTARTAGSSLWCLTQLLPGGAGECEADAASLHSTL